jgi:hypothetical protein
VKAVYCCSRRLTVRGWRPLSRRAVSTFEPRGGYRLSQTNASEKPDLAKKKCYQCAENIPANSLLFLGSSRMAKSGDGLRSKTIESFSVAKLESRFVAAAGSRGRLRSVTPRATRFPVRREGDASVADFWRAACGEALLRAGELGFSCGCTGAGK